MGPQVQDQGCLREEDQDRVRPVPRAFGAGGGKALPGVPVRRIPGHCHRGRRPRAVEAPGQGFRQGASLRALPGRPGRLRPSVPGTKSKSYTGIIN